MKAKIPLFATAAFCCFLTAYTPVFGSIGTAFTYQGRVSNSNSPASGTYDLTFKLWNASSGGAQVGATITATGTVITNGLFTQVLDFGSQFDGTSYWLELGVRTNGAVSFATLSPRQQLTPAPYAISAENVIGSVPAGQLTGTVPPTGLGGLYLNPVDLNNPGNVFDGNGAGLTGVNALTLDGLSAANFWQLTGNAGTTPGVNFVGTIDATPFFLDVNGSPVLKLSTNNSITMGNGTLGNSPFYNYEVALGQSPKAIANGSVAIGWNPTSSGPGSVAIGESVVSSANDSFASGGYSQATGQDATAMGYSTIASGAYSMSAGYQAQALNAGSFVWADESGGVFTDHGPNQFLIRAQGGVGIGTTGAPQQFLSVHGGVNIDQANLNAGFINDGLTNGYGLTFGSGSGEGIASERIAGVNQYGLDFYTSFIQRLSIHNNGDVSLNGNPLLLESSTDGSFAADGLYWGNGGLPGINFAGDGPFLAGFEGGSLGGLSPNTVCLSWDYSGNVWVSNNLSTATLSIRGGADLAEPFNITSGTGEVPQGAVVVIDDQNPGHLKLSDTPYDPHVAGVVSGANGINPGIQMHQQGLIEGGKNVALTGRVYVQADAANGAIRPGDMLTTSSTPGCAMKVSDHARAVGAILGKAMTGLSEGKGMVLVLVTLQ
ncbi:MAG: hypothetical protein WAO02_04340 [Verrucomicrobiia bacterium]